jgi:hypothetical protein
MTKDKIKRLRNKIEDSRSRLMFNQPFFAILLMYVKFEAVTHMKRISTNGKSIYFNPSFIDKLNNDELDYILCHQIMHIINEDVWRSEDLAYSNYHYACDVKLNDILADFGFSMERTSHLPKREIKIAGTEIETKNATTIELADSIIFNLEFMDEKTRNAFIVDSDEYWGKKEETAVLILNSVDGTYIDIFTKNICANFFKNTPAIRANFRTRNIFAIIKIFRCTKYFRNNIITSTNEHTTICFYLFPLNITKII